jgi:hypothetical protein
MAAVYCQNITEVVGIRRQMWNPVLYAIERGHLDVLKFFVEKLGVNIKLCLKDPSQTEEKQYFDFQWQQGLSKCFAIRLAIKNQ